jgi:Domain of unknown function (DUF4386)
MTRTTNARLAGFMYLFYIATAFPQVVLFDRASGGEGIAGKLASIAQHAPLMRLNVLLSLVTFVDAVVLAVALYGLTRDEDHELAVLALSCRVAEGVLATMPVETLGLLWLATPAAGAVAPDAATANALGAFLLRVGTWQTLAAATCFAVGSTIFSWLFVRARTIPVWLARLGVLGSLLLVVGLPLQMAGYLRGTVTNLMWIPVAVFEVVLGFWLLIKGVGAPRPRPAAA